MSDVSEAVEEGVAEDVPDGWGCAIYLAQILWRGFESKSPFISFVCQFGFSKGCSNGVFRVMKVVKGVPD